MRALDGQTFQNISATTAAFNIESGGKYGVEVLGSTFGTVTLQRLGPDGSTWLTVGSAFAANGYQVMDIPAGSYRVAIATATAVYVTMRRIPGE